MKRLATEEELDLIWDDEAHYIPNNRLVFLIIVQSCAIGLFFYLIGETYINNNNILCLLLQFIICPLSIAVVLFVSLIKAKQPENKTILKKALKVFGIAIATLLLIVIICVIAVWIFAWLLKSGNTGGGNPWL